MATKNRLFVGIPGYGSVQFRWVREWFRFQSEIARERNLAHVFCTEMPYPDAAMNTIVSTALKYDDWDYLLVLEHDNIAPSGWVSRIGQLDPTVHQIVGALYFGRAQEDQRPIPGYIREDGSYERLSEDQVRQMRAKPDLYPVDALGMGCTLIHRAVLENWSPPGEEPHEDGRFDWFKQGVRANGFLGHDLAFCIAAAKQGHRIWVDSASVSRHIGTFLSDDETFLATVDHMHAREEMEAMRSRRLEVLRGTEWTQ